MTPRASCLWHCADFSQRYESIVVPACLQGKLVLMDRYIYTAYVRDSLRGIDLSYVEYLYGYAPKPDLLIYLDADPAIAAERKSGYGFYESGEDFLQLPDSAATRKDFFIKFQGMCRQRYLEVLPDYAIHVDGNAPQEEVRQKVLAIVLDKWRELKGNTAAGPR
jgi:dTMP kinase